MHVKLNIFSFPTVRGRTVIGFQTAVRQSLINVGCYGTMTASNLFCIILQFVCNMTLKLINRRSDAAFTQISVAVTYRELYHLLANTAP